MPTQWERFGADASRLMVTVWLAVPPALVAEHVNVSPVVSAVTLLGPQPVDDEIDDSASVTVQVRPTLLVYHPLVPRVPVMFGVMTGGVASAGAPTLIE